MASRELEGKAVGVDDHWESLLESPEVLEVTNMVKSPKSLEQRTGKTQLYLINN